MGSYMKYHYFTSEVMEVFERLDLPLKSNAELLSSDNNQIRTVFYSDLTDEELLMIKLYLPKLTIISAYHLDNLI